MLDTASLWRRAARGTAGRRPAGHRPFV